jgi:alkylation response protein AidB-like acyl-CoA dehydrogenase
MTCWDALRKTLLPDYIERAASTVYPMDVHRRLGDLGVLGIGLPERLGGTVFSPLRRQPRLRGGPRSSAPMRPSPIAVR